MSALVSYTESSSSSSAGSSPPASPSCATAVVSLQSSYQVTSLKRKRASGAREARNRSHSGNDNGANTAIANHRLLRRINGNANVSSKGSGYGFSTLLGKNKLGLEMASDDNTSNGIDSKRVGGNEGAAVRTTEVHKNSSTNGCGRSILSGTDNTTTVQITENEKREKRRKTELQQRQRQKLLVQQQRKRQQHELKEPLLPSKPNSSSSDADLAIPRLPTLPSKFLDLYSAPPRASTSDDPNLHSGRRRQNPHVEGQWPAHVYLEWHPNQQTRTLLSRLLEIHQQLSPPSPSSNSNITQTALQSDASTSQFILYPLHHTTPPCTPLPLHISLSAPLVLPSIQAANAFRLNLSTALKELRSGEVRVQLGGNKAKENNGGSRRRKEPLKWVRNADGSRWFLVVGVDDTSTSGRNEIKEEKEDSRLPTRKSSGPPVTVSWKSGASSDSGGGAMRGNNGYSYGRGYGSGNGYTPKTRKVHSRTTATITNGSLDKANTLLTKATYHGIPPLQSLLAATDAIALQFGLKRFADGYGRHGNGIVEKSAQRQYENGRELKINGGQDFNLALGSGSPHISLAWTLSEPDPDSKFIDDNNRKDSEIQHDAQGVVEENVEDDVDGSLRREYASLLDKLTRLVLVFRQVKIKIGRDVCVVRLRGQRRTDECMTKGVDSASYTAGRAVKDRSGVMIDRVGDRDRGQAAMEEEEEEVESDLVEVEEADEAEESREEFRKERNILGYD